MTLPKVPNIHSMFYKPVEQANNFWLNSILLPMLLIAGFTLYVTTLEQPITFTNYKLAYAFLLLSSCSMAFAIRCSTHKLLKTPELKNPSLSNLGIILNTISLIIYLAAFTAATTLAGKTTLFTFTAIAIALMLSHYAYKGSDWLIHNACYESWAYRRRQYLQWRLGKVFSIYRNIAPEVDDKEIQIYNNTCESKDTNHIEMALARFEHLVEKIRAGK